jgi:gliding motility-associated-like protein
LYDPIVENIVTARQIAQRRIFRPLMVSALFLLPTAGHGQAVVLDSVTIAPGTCGLADGSLTAFSSFGVGPVTYSVDGGVSFQSSGTFSALLPGSYNVIARDSAGFTSTLTILLPGSASLITASTPTDPLCAGDANGSIDITASGGTAPLAYSIDKGATYQAGQVFNNLPAGTYSIVVQDGQFCHDSVTVVLADPAALVLGTATTDENCPAADGTITLSGAGGTVAYQFSINGGTTFQAGGSFTGLASGSYVCVIMDANGCTQQSAVVVNSAAGTGPDIFALNHINPLCNGSGNGSITVIALGSAPLQYSIDGGATFNGTNIFTNLTPETYPVLIEDAAGCITGSVVDIVEPAVLQSAVTALDETCVGNDGSIVLVATGGTAPYTYSFDGGATSGANASLLNISGGTYDIVVTDDNGCTETAQVVLQTGVGPSITQLVATDPSCPGTADGSIVITAISQTATITYSIDGGATIHPTGMFTQLMSGTYNVVLEDGNGCTTAQTVTLIGPVTPFADFTPDVTAGFIPVTVNFTDNSVGAVTYAWTFGPAGANSTQPSPTYTYNSAGTYNAMLVVSDGVCNDTAMVTIVVDGEPSITVPNIFTPNGDGVNDFFYCQPIGIVSLTGTIYNRYGEIVYFWAGAEGGWDGHTIPAGIPCSDGVYFYVISAEDINGNPIEEKGTVQLLRTTNKRQR